MWKFFSFAVCFGILCHSGIEAAELIGRKIDAIALKDHRGNSGTLSDYADSKLIVVAFLGTECPLAKLYCGRLEQLSKKYPIGDLQVLGINSNVQDSLSEIEVSVRKHQLTYPMFKDVGQKIASQLGATRTPEIFLLDQNRIVRYHGRVDDQYVVGIVRDKATRNDLEEAIQELLAGKAVSVAATQPQGCLIGRDREVKENSPVTYSNQIARIFQNNCEECHRDGEIAPFSLTSYDDAVGWGDMIAEVVKEQRMPPWHANPAHGKFENDRSLSEEDKQLIYQWVENGCPEGDQSQLPEPKSYVAGWSMSKEPDQVFEMRETAFDVPAEAGPEGVEYQNFWVDTKFKEDKWVTYSETKPGNRAIVHHIIVYVHPGGRNSKENIFFSAYVPGLRPDELPPGYAKKIPAGSWLRFQVHYTPIGSPQTDLSSVGFVYTEADKVEREIHTSEAGNAKFVIQPFKDNQTFTAKSPAAPVDMTLLSMSPHMHLRGKSFKYEAEYPDGTSEVLLDVPAYDFNWQTRYLLAEPKRLPQGTRMLCTATYDNSENNLANPDPAQEVRWGDQSWDEMLLGYFDVVVDVGVADAGKPVRNKPNAKPPAAVVQLAKTIQSLDKDKDQKVSREEAKGLEILDKNFDKVDANKDGYADVSEIVEALKRLKK